MGRFGGVDFVYFDGCWGRHLDGEMRMFLELRDLGRSSCFSVVIYREERVYSQVLCCGHTTMFEIFLFPVGNNSKYTGSPHTTWWALEKKNQAHKKYHLKLKGYGALSKLIDWLMLWSTNTKARVMQRASQSAWPRFFRTLVALLDNFVFLGSGKFHMNDAFFFFFSILRRLSPEVFNLLLSASFLQAFCFVSLEIAMMKQYHV